MLSHYDNLQSRPAQPVSRSEKKSAVRPLHSPAAGAVTRELIAAKYDLAVPVSEGITPAYLRSREASLLRELTPIENELATVRQQLASLK